MNNFSFYKGGQAFYCLIFLGCFWSSAPVFAKSLLRQQQSFSQNIVRGTVTDGTNPLPGVTIAIKGKPNSTAISDYTGAFSIAASPIDVLVVSFIGFKTEFVPIAGQQQLTITLDYDTTTLQEVRVNAGYYSTKESERTGSIARITSKDIATQPVTNVLATMQGRMAGVNITQTTGVPGGGFVIKIRGQNSLRTDANVPLYIIDGVPYSSDPIGYNQTATTFPTVTSPLNNINPDNIESIEILKDADATSIYGSRGANGVVLITTKKGKAGKTTFSFTASTGAGKVTRFLDLMDTQQYLKMRKQAFINDGIASYNAWDYDINGTWDQNRQTNWQKKLLGGTAQINNLQGSISGGSDTTQFLFSGSYHSESTVFPGDFLYKKGGAALSINHQSEDNKFRFTFSGNYNVQQNDQPAFDLTYEARSLAPNAPELFDNQGNLNWDDGTWDNPLRNRDAEFKSATNDLVANSVLSYEIATGLTIKSSFGITNLQTIETRTAPSTVFNPAYGVTSANSSIYVNTTGRSSRIAEPQVNYEKEFSGGRIGLLLGATFQTQTTNTLYQSGDGFSSNSLIYNLASANFVTAMVNDETQYKYQAFFGRVNYNLLQRYIVNLTARRDGSSRFGPGNQFANFAAIGAAWLFSKESFLRDNAFLSFGKLRASYGITGNDQIGDYQFLNTYTTTGINYYAIIGLEPSRLYNPDFGWETNKKLELALESGFFNDRLFTTVAWYQNRSSNQLVGIPLPGTTGFTTLQANLDATVENTGFEITLRTNQFSKGKFKWITSLNLTAARNKLLRFPGLENSPYSQQYRIGEPLNIKLVYQYKGINPQSGVYEFEDLNKDGLITFPNDRQKTVDLNPKYFGGIQNQLTYKNWKLDFLFQFVNQKNYLYPMGYSGIMSNQQSRITDSWTQPGDKSAYQIATTGSNSAAVTANYFYSRSDASITDASFIRLKNIALSYDVPMLMHDIQCKVLLQGQNLLTFTSYKDGDPEFSGYGYLPPLKVITAGIQLTF